MQANYQIVPFEGQDIVVFSEQKMVAIKPICDNIGLDWSGQRQRIRRTDIFASVQGMLPATGSDGKVYEMLCLPLDKFLMWLAGIETKRIKNTQVREFLIKYQEKAGQVLMEYFLGSQISGDTVTLPALEYVELLQNKIELLEQKLKHSRGRNLSPMQKETIMRLFDDGYTYYDIGLKVGRPEATIRNFLYKRNRKEMQDGESK